MPGDSWEAGTRAETLIEIDYPSVSVFSSQYLSSSPPSTTTLAPVLDIALNAVNNRSSTGQLWGSDGSSGDPASLGVPVLLANWTSAMGANWASAAQQQLNLLLYDTPRTTDGAISHRTDTVELWSDFIYMVPPFLAYYGAVTSNASLISTAYTQISLYRSYLLDTNVSLWRHIYVPESSSAGAITDTGHWSTGNGWAAAGILRVLGTIKYSPFASQFSSEQNDLSNWVTEIHTGMAANIPSTGVFNNYADQQQTNQYNFPDASGTALFAASVYRHVTLSNPSNYQSIVSAAEQARQALYADDGQVHFDSQGWLTPVVDPNVFSTQGSMSPEAQCFVLQLNNNWQAWSAKKTTSRAVRSKELAGGVSSLPLFTAGLGILVSLLMP